MKLQRPYARPASRLKSDLLRLHIGAVWRLSLPLCLPTQLLADGFL